MNPDTHHISLMVGELRGDVKALLASHVRLDRSIEEAAEKLEAELAAQNKRIATLEGYRIRIAAVAVGAALASPAFAQALSPLLQAIFP